MEFQQSLEELLPRPLVPLSIDSPLESPFSAFQLFRRYELIFPNKCADLKLHKERLWDYSLSMEFQLLLIQQSHHLRVRLMKKVTADES